MVRGNILSNQTFCAEVADFVFTKWPVPATTDSNPASTWGPQEHLSQEHLANLEQIVYIYLTSLAAGWMMATRVLPVCEFQS